MTYRCLFAALLSGALLLSLSACDDSSTVGLGVGGPDSLADGRPTAVSALPDTFDTFTSVDVTSQVATSPDSIPSNGHRILVGTVTDPLVGTIATRGHIDFRQPANIGGFESIEGINLVLQTEYRYGDTTGVQTIDVREADMEIESGWTADEEGISVGNVLTSFNLAAEDTVVTVPLPSNWVDLNGPRFFSTSSGNNAYDALFEGLVLTTQSGNRVTGFDRESSFLEIAYRPDSASQDTIEFTGAKSFTHIERTSTASTPPGRKLLLDGIGTGLVTSFDFSAEPFASLGLVPVNRAELNLPIDSTTVSQSTPANFVRPDPEGLFLRAQVAEDRRNVTNTGELALCRGLGLQTTIESSCLINLATSSASLRGPNSQMRLLVEESISAEYGAAKDTPLFDKYILEQIAGEPTITPLLLFAPVENSSNPNPQLQVTVVPQE
ncbi:hypothetical protein CRI94_07520 [Longibacter salinarum]|uniref:Lipoprotein n=1 Tax=Longibacter salinarum TaxID=1850348 RepID=A0A2A8CZ94_9BACT|nr:DUF4270 family protein [Longibacter salinarum]PEN13897.1 hypothetical protein CRI94_07520 [Longibacter salinarum]